MKTLTNEFEKYPDLAEQLEGYAKNGRFHDWQKFTDTLNSTLKEAIEQIAEGGYKLIEGNEVNSILAVSLRRLNDNQLVALRDALIERTIHIEQSKPRWISDQEIKDHIKNNTTLFGDPTHKALFELGMREMRRLILPSPPSR